MVNLVGPPMGPKNGQEITSTATGGIWPVQQIPSAAEITRYICQPDSVPPIVISRSTGCRMIGHTLLNELSHVKHTRQPCTRDALRHGATPHAPRSRAPHQESAINWEAQRPCHLLRPAPRARRALLVRRCASAQTM
jgi:hypothetical protein